MPENNEMNTVAVETATEAVTEAAQNAPDTTTNNSFTNQHPVLAACAVAAGVTGSMVIGAWAAEKLTNVADSLSEKWHNWRQNRKAKKAAKNNEPIEVTVEQKENA